MNYDLGSQAQQKSVPQHGKGPEISVPVLPQQNQNLPHHTPMHEHVSSGNPKPVE